MAVFPEQISNHSGKHLSVRERPVGSRKPGIMAGHIRAGNYEKERRARHKHGEAVNTFGHLRLPIADLPATVRLPSQSAMSLMIMQRRERDGFDNRPRAGLDRGRTAE